MSETRDDDKTMLRVAIAALMLPELFGRAHGVTISHRCDIALAHADVLLERAETVERPGGELLAVRLREIAPLVRGVAPDAESVIEAAASLLDPPMPVPA